MKTVDAAKGYAALGISVIPLHPKGPNAKRPLLKWEPYQSRIASPEEIDSWWRRWPDANVGIVTGAVSRLIAIDLDSPVGQEALSSYLGEIPNTIRQTTGKPGGMHLLFAHPMDGSYKTFARALQDTDVRGDGGYIVAAPSVHENGTQYEWIIDPLEMGLDDLLPLPDELRQIISVKLIDQEAAGPKDPNWFDKIKDGVEAGSRNQAATQLVGWLIRKFAGNLDDIQAWMEIWNRQNKPPMERKELLYLVKAAYERWGTEPMSEILAAGGCQVAAGPIQQIQVLSYPDGTKLYNIYVAGHPGYAQMDMATLKSHALFSTKYAELTNHIPKKVQAEEWRIAVNAALSQAQHIQVPEEETTVGAIASIVDILVRGAEETDKLDLVQTRPVKVRKGDEVTVLFKLTTLIHLLAGDGEKVQRKSLARHLRDMGVAYRPVRTSPSQVVHVWQVTESEWALRRARMGQKAIEASARVAPAVTSSVRSVTSSQSDYVTPNMLN